MIALLIDESGCCFEVIAKQNFRHDVFIKYDDMFDNTTSGKSVICVTVVKLCLWRLLLRVATMISDKEVVEYSSKLCMQLKEEVASLFPCAGHHSCACHSDYSII